MSYLKKHLRDQNETEYHGNGKYGDVNNGTKIIFKTAGLLIHYYYKTIFHKYI